MSQGRGQLQAGNLQAYSQITSLYSTPYLRVIYLLDLKDITTVAMKLFPAKLNSIFYKYKIQCL